MRSDKVRFQLKHTTGSRMKQNRYRPEGFYFYFFLSDRHPLFSFLPCLFICFGHLCFGKCEHSDEANPPTQKAIFHVENLKQRLRVLWDRVAGMFFYLFFPSFFFLALDCDVKWPDAFFFSPIRNGDNITSLDERKLATWVVRARTQIVLFLFSFLKIHFLCYVCVDRCCVERPPCPADDCDHNNYNCDSQVCRNSNLFIYFLFFEKKSTNQFGNSKKPVFLARSYKIPNNNNNIETRE